MGLEIARFIDFLDTNVGKDNYTLFLTDHAAVQVPSYLQSVKVPAGYLDNKAFKKYLNELANILFGSG